LQQHEQERARLSEWGRSNAETAESLAQREAALLVREEECAKLVEWQRQREEALRQTQEACVGPSIGTFSDSRQGHDGSSQYGSLSSAMCSEASVLTELDTSHGSAQASDARAPRPSYGNTLTVPGQEAHQRLTSRKRCAKAQPARKDQATEPPETWKSEALEAHNKFRAAHGAPPLTWSEECYNLAKLQANVCQAEGVLVHGFMEGPSGQHGQNAFWSSRPGEQPAVAAAAWYGEIEDPGYDFDKAGFTMGSSHFTQLVWRETREVGMAVSNDGKYFVANYLPAGNFEGRFEENVLPACDGTRPASFREGDATQGAPFLQEPSEDAATDEDQPLLNRQNAREFSREPDAKRRATSHGFWGGLFSRR